MALLIDKTYFIREINIPGTGSDENLALFIAEREPEYLISVLGYDLYKLYESAIPAEGDRWYKLINGAEYTDCDDRLNKWEGFVNELKKSPIACYVFYWYLRNSMSHATGIGTVKAKGENSKAVDSVNKQVQAWSKMVDMNEKLLGFLVYAKNDDGSKLFPEFDGLYMDYSMLSRLNGVF